MVIPLASWEDELLVSIQETVTVDSSIVGARRSTAVPKLTTGTFEAER